MRSPETAVRRTPLLSYMGTHRGWESVFLKDETKQETGSFKFRGIWTKLSTLPPSSYVVAASTGNHGYGLAIAARSLRMRAFIFLPSRTSGMKVNSVISTGAEVTLVDGDFDDSVEVAQEYAESKGYTFVSGFDDIEVILGHQSICAEIDADCPQFDTVFVPVGGGGLLAACLLHWRFSKRVIGVEFTAATSLKESLTKGKRIRTAPAHGMAEGLLVRTIGKIPFEICSRFQPRIDLVDSPAIESAIASLWFHNNIVSEGAGAAALAAALEDNKAAGCCVCIVSGGNIDEITFRTVVDAQFACGLPHK